MDGQKPSIGRIVLFGFQKADVPQGIMRECPAMITAVWSDTCVNLHLLRDANHHSIATNDTPTSVTLGDASMTGRYWRWPDRA